MSGEIMGESDVSAHRLKGSAHLVDHNHAIGVKPFAAENVVQVFMKAPCAIATDRGRDHDEATPRGAPRQER